MVPAKAKPCPHCGESVKPVSILYGYPTHEGIQQAERGEVVLGGCVVGG